MYTLQNGQKIEHHRAFRISYLPCTNTKPSRCKIVDLRHKQTAIFSLSSLILDSAIEHLEGKGIVCSGFSSDNHTGDYYIFTLDFVTKLK